MPYKNAPVQSLNQSLSSSKPSQTSVNNTLPPLLPTPRGLPNYYTPAYKPPQDRGILPPPRTNYPRPEGSTTIRNTTREERDDRRKQGLCMWCGVKYTLTHNCVKSQLYQLLIEDQEGKEEDLEVFFNCLDTMEESVVKEEKKGTLHAISLQALWGNETY